MTSRYFAFLRAINVGGHTVKMTALRAIFESLGFENVDTFIASGNVAFRAGSSDHAALEARIEIELRSKLGYEVVTFLRSESELESIAQHKAFPNARVDKAVSYNVGFTRTTIGVEAKKKLMALKTDIDDFHVHGREYYWLCLKGQSASTFSNVLFERRTGLQSTLRGVKTVRNMADKYLAEA